MSDQEVRLLEFLLKIVDQEHGLDVIRRMLAEVPSFDPLAAFQILNKGGGDTLSAHDIALFLAKFGIHVTSNVISVLGASFSADGTLDFPNFLRLVLPRDHPTLNRLKELKTIIPSRAKMPEMLSEALYVMAKLLEKVTQSAQALTIARAIYFKGVPTIEVVEEGFSILDEARSGVLDFAVVRRFFERRGVHLPTDDLWLLLSFLDRDTDGRISVSDWTSALVPDRNLNRQSMMKNTPRTTTPATARPGNRTIQSSRSPAQTRDYSSATTAKKTKPPRVAGNSPAVPKTAKKSSPAKGASSIKKSSSVAAIDLQRNSPQKGERYVTPSKIRGVESVGNLNSRPPLRRVEPRVTAAITPPKLARSASSARSLGKGKTILTEKSRREATLSKILAEVFRIEASTENEKQVLLMRGDFDIYSAFALFDVRRRGFIAEGDICEALRRFGVKFDRKVLKLFLLRHDRDGDAQLNFGEFVAALESKVRFEDEAAPKGPRQSEGSMSAETIHTLMMLVKLLIQEEQYYETLRRQLAEVVSLNEAFNLLDVERRGYVTAQDLQAFLERCSIKFSSNHLDVVLRKLDVDRDGRVSFIEFINEFTPHLYY
eukprot:TRINITY_DN9565_c0_g1_i1.p1 TRINITY_DN9565_c0_g1~~TRINITY_DN9565_c0_g1_i1.p1  ORF type:complete len:600 (+),score=161.82 TRINITY_DN9565_c0_g1_i1:51-1850(+)